jgi:FKBP-type peptidyl-prolyl cis-trans isomerase
MIYLMSRTRFAGVTSAALLAAVCIAAPFAPQQDLSSIPPEPAKVHSRLAGLKVGLAQAIDIAQKDTGGLAHSAQITGELAEVVIFAADKSINVTVDTATGEVKSKMDVPKFAMPGDPVTGEPTTTESGLMYYDITVGDGAQPAGPTSTVNVHYTGWLVDGKKFDSSVDRGQPISFPLNGVIKGWTEGVGSMKVGGKRKLVIPYDLAYGAGGRPPVIPAKAMLIFDVELLGVTNQ